MAGPGRFPGVDLPPIRRKRTQRHEAYANYREPPPREWLEPSVNQVSSIDLDDAAHKARRRLEKKLGYHKPSPSLTKKAIQAQEDIREHKMHITQLEIKRKERGACGICLEDFEAEKQAVDLSCAHKFHSNCLLPWLHVHPDCPYCRTPVRCS